MTNKAFDKFRPGRKLDALTAERVFGWKNVHKHEGSLVGRKQDKAGSVVPYYSTNPIDAYFEWATAQTMKKGLSYYYIKTRRRINSPRNTNVAKPQKSLQAASL